LQPEVRFATRLFRIAAIYGVIVLLPLYFIDVPDPYRLNLVGFAGVTLVFQGMFWIIARDPLRFLPLIALSVFEKLAFGVPAIAFWARGQTDGVTAAFGAIDLLFGAAFLLAYARLRRLS
jgi:hypothetical protein